jgi:prepilin-type N-terminal cleavage/methylation domain-containing protein
VVQLLVVRRNSYVFMARKQQQVSGVTLTELLCVIAIIAILLALSMGPIIKAFIHVKKFLGD